MPEYFTVPSSPSWMLNQGSHVSAATTKWLASEKLPLIFGKQFNAYKMSLISELLPTAMIGKGLETWYMKCFKWWVGTLMNYLIFIPRFHPFAWVLQWPHKLIKLSWQWIPYKCHRWSTDDGEETRLMFHNSWWSLFNELVRAKVW